MQDGMFHRISDFGFARNARQALGFYLFHLFVGAMGFMLAVLCYKLVFGLEQGDATLLSLSKVSSMMAMVYVGYLNVKLLQAKGRMTQLSKWLYAVLALFLSLGGILLGLVVPACFSILRPLPRVAPANGYISEEEQP